MPKVSFSLIRNIFPDRVVNYEFLRVLTLNLIQKQQFVFYGFIDEEKEREVAVKGTFKVPKPSDIKNHLDDYVIGQTRAKKALSPVSTI